MSGIYRELSRRNVFRVAGGYAIVAWLIVQVASAIHEPLNLPDWFDTVIVLLLALGFPVAVVLAWAFELTPEGIRPAAALDGAESVLPTHRMLFDAVIVIGLVAMIGLTFRGGNVDTAGPGLAGGGQAGPAPAATMVSSPAIAVLPFADLSPDRDHEYLADGVAEELLAELSRLRGLATVGRQSAFSFKNSDETLAEIAEQLDVTHLLEGSLRPAGDTIRIRVQLTDNTGFTIWTETYDRPTNDIFDIQRDIARAVAEQLSIELGVAAVLVSREPIDTAAYDALLHGRFELAARTDSSIQRGYEYLLDAVELAPLHAPAHAGLADAYILLGSYNLMPLSESHPRARESALRAIELDPGLAEAWTSLAALNADYFWNWDESGAQFERAIELNPNYPIAHQWYAEYLQRMGRVDEALTAAARARALDPLSPLQNSAMAIAYYRARRFDEAIAQAEYALDLNPDFVTARIGLVLSRLQSGNYDDALASLPPEPGNSTLVSLSGYAHGFAGFEQEARGALARLQSMDSALPLDLAIIHLALGEFDETFRYLDAAYENRDWMMGFLRVDPIWDPLRGTARFDELLARMNLDD